MLLQLLLNGLVTGALYAVIASGFAVAYNATRVFNISYSALLLIPSFVLYTLYRQCAIPFPVAITIAVLTGILTGVLLELSVFRPLERKSSSPNIYLVSSIGVSIVLINLLSLIYGNETKVVFPVITNSHVIGSLIITDMQIFQFGAAIVLLLGYTLILELTPMGMTARALRDNPLLCSIYGLKIERARCFVFGMSGLLAGAGGMFVACDVGIEPTAGMPMFLNAVVAVIVGGIGRFRTPIIGGFVVGILQSTTVWVWSSQWQEATTFAVLVLFLIFRPRGIAGEKERAF